MKLTNAIDQLLEKSDCDRATLSKRKFGSYIFEVNAYKSGLIVLLYYDEDLCDQVQKGPLYIGFGIHFKREGFFGDKPTEFRQLLHYGVLDRELSAWRGDLLLDLISPHNMLNRRAWMRVLQAEVEAIGQYFWAPEGR